MAKNKSTVKEKNTIKEEVVKENLEEVVSPSKKSETLIDKVKPTKNATPLPASGNLSGIPFWEVPDFIFGQLILDGIDGLSINNSWANQFKSAIYLNKLNVVKVRNANTGAFAEIII